jgi:hypothetical protein
MSFAAKIRGAASRAQSVLAQTGGAESGESNALYNGAEYFAVYGAPSVERDMLPNGGFRQRSVIIATATRSQFATAPKSETKWIRTDLPQPVTFTIMKVNADDAYLYVITLVKLGA